MKAPPVCTKCGQSDEFLVSEDNLYTCVCGHQFTLSNLFEAMQHNNNRWDITYQFNPVSGR